MAEFSHYRIEIRRTSDDATVRAFEPVYETRLTYSLADNAADHGGTPTRSFKAALFKISDNGDVSEAQIQTISNPAPAAPASVTLTAVGNAVEVAPSLVSETDIRGMRVWMGTSPDFTVDDNSLVYDAANTRALVPVTATGTRYFRVAYFDSLGKHELNLSAEASIELFEQPVKDDVPPAVPTSLSASQLFLGAELSWVNPPDDDFSHVEVWTSQTNSFASASIAETVSAPASAVGIVGLEVGATYYFWLRAVDIWGNTSAETSSASLTILGIGNDQLDPNSISWDRMNVNSGDIPFNTLGAIPNGAISLQALAQSIQDEINRVVEIGKSVVPGGINAGANGDLQFYPNTDWNGGSHSGEIGVGDIDADPDYNGSFTHPTLGRIDVTAHYIHTPWEGGVEGSVPEGQRFYVMYSATDPDTRFGWTSQGSTQFTTVTYDDATGVWTAYGNLLNDATTFTPDPTDLIVAMGTRSSTAVGGIETLTSLIGSDVPTMQRVTALEATSGDHESRITTQETVTGQHASRLTATESVANDAQSRVATQETVTAGHASRLTATETVANDAQSRVATQETTTAGLAARTDELSVSLAPEAIMYPTSETWTGYSNYIAEDAPNWDASYLGTDAGGRTYAKVGNSTGYFQIAMVKATQPIVAGRVYRVVADIEVIDASSSVELTAHSQNPNGGVTSPFWSHKLSAAQPVGRRIYEGTWSDATGEGIDRAWHKDLDEVAIRFGVKCNVGRLHVYSIKITDVTEEVSQLSRIVTQETVTAGHATRLTATESVANDAQSRVATQETTTAGHATRLSATEVQINGALPLLPQGGNLALDASHWYMSSSDNSSAGFTGEDIDGLSSTTPCTVGTATAGSTTGKGLQGYDGRWMFTRYAIPVDTARRYRMRVKVLFPAGVDGLFYAGLATLDGSFNAITGGAGTHRYFVGSYQQATFAGTVRTFEGEITGEGDASTQFRAGTQYARPMIITSYNADPGPQPIVLSIDFDDVTEEVAIGARTGILEEALWDGSETRARVMFLADANGHVASGWLTSSSNPEGVAQSEIGWVADKFKIFNGSTLEQIFQVDTNNNKLFMNGDIIASGSLSGSVIAAASKVTVGTGALIPGTSIYDRASMAGHDNGDYRFWAGGLSGADANFSVNREGAIEARKLTILTEDGGSIWFDTVSGFSEIARAQLLAQSATRVATIAESVSTNTQATEFSLTDTTNVKAEVSVSKSGLTVAQSWNYNEAEPADAFPSSLSLVIKYRNKATGGAWSTGVSKTLTKITSGTPTSTQFKVEKTVVQPYYDPEWGGAFNNIPGSKTETVTEPASLIADFTASFVGDADAETYEVIAELTPVDGSLNFDNKSRTITLTSPAGGKPFVILDDGAVPGDGNAETLSGFSHSDFGKLASANTWAQIQTFDQMITAAKGVRVSAAGTYNAGNDNRTDVGLILPSGAAIHGESGGYLRYLFEWNSSDKIVIGQTGTTMISGVSLQGGFSGGVDMYHAGAEVVRTMSDGISIGAVGSQTSFWSNSSGAVIDYTVANDFRIRTQGNDRLVYDHSANWWLLTNNAGLHMSANSSRVKLGLWNSTTTYGIGMQSAMTYGHLNDWAMTFCFNNDTNRGFWWGHEGMANSQGAMSLTTDGRLYVDQSIEIAGNPVATQAWVASQGYITSASAVTLSGTNIWTANNTFNTGILIGNAGTGDDHRFVSWNDGGAGQLIISHSNSSWDTSLRLGDTVASIYANGLNYQFSDAGLDMTQRDLYDVRRAGFGNSLSGVNADRAVDIYQVESGNDNVHKYGLYSRINAGGSSSNLTQDRVRAAVYGYAQLNDTSTSAQTYVPSPFGGYFYGLVSGGHANNAYGSFSLGYASGAAADVANLYGSLGEARIGAAGTVVNNMYGVMGTVRTIAGINTTIANAYGMRSLLNHDGGTITTYNMIHGYADIEVGATVTTIYGLRLDLENSFDGTVTNRRGIWLEADPANTNNAIGGRTYFGDARNWKDPDWPHVVHFHNTLSTVVGLVEGTTDGAYWRYSRAGAYIWDVGMDAGSDFLFRPNGTTTALRLNYDMLEAAFNSTGLSFDNKQALSGNDSWLRLNGNGQFTSGIYCASSQVRTDGYFGAGGDNWRAYADRMESRFGWEYHQREPSWNAQWAYARRMKWAWNATWGDYAYFGSTGNDIGAHHTAAMFGSSTAGIGFGTGIEAGNDLSATWMHLYADTMYLQGKSAFRYNDSWLRLNPDGQFTDGVYFGSSLVRTDGTFGINNSVFMEEGFNSSLRVQNTNGYLDIGPQNASYCHFQTDRTRFYFNKDVYVHGTMFIYNSPSYMQDGLLNVEHSGASRARVKVHGAGAGYTTADILLEDDSAQTVRGMGMFMYNRASGKEWFYGQPYNGDENRAGVYYSYQVNGSEGGETANENNAIVEWNNSGQVLFQSGSAALPSMAFHDNPDCGFRLSSNEIIVGSDGNNVMGWKPGRIEVYNNSIIDFNTHTGARTMMELEGRPIMNQMSDRGALLLRSADDSLTLFAGDSHNTLTDNVSMTAESIFMGAESEFFLYTNLQHGWANRHTLSFSYAGVLTASGNIVQNSDRRLKTGIQPLVDVFLDKLNPVYFTWLRDNRLDFGFIAQEVEEFFPEAVTEDKDGIKSIDYGRMAVVAIAAVKNERKRVDSLEARLERIETLLEAA